MIPSQSNVHIGIFRALQLGDMLCAIPAVRAIRYHNPGARITLIGLPWAKDLINRFPGYFDELLVFPGYEGLPEQPFNPKAYDEFVESVRAARFDWLLQMQGNGTIVNEMLLQFRALNVAGFHRMDCRMESKAFLEYPEGIHEIERHLALVKHLGVEPQGDQLEFPVDPLEVEAAQEKFWGIIDTPYICVHPGSRDKDRQWDPVYFAKLADYCAFLGYQVIVTGTDNEKEITAQVASAMKYPSLDLAGKTNLDSIAFLIGRAKLLISNCTGVSHIASAMQTPSIIISMDGEPERWGPVNKKLHAVFDWIKEPDFEKVERHLGGLLSPV